MKIFISVLAVFLFIFFSMNNFSSLPKQDQKSSQVIIKFGQEMKNKKNLNLCGIGGGANNGLWLLNASFETYQEPLTQSKARKLIVECVEDFLSTINEDEQLKPYLKVYPFTIENIELRIFCYTPDKNRIFDPYIGVVSCLRGIINYDTNDPLDPYKYKANLEESYEEALSILKKQEEVNK